MALSETEIRARLRKFTKAVLGRSLYSACTGNKGVYPPQCVDGAQLWATHGLGMACIHTSDNARGMFEGADPQHWFKIRNTENGVPEAGDIVILSHKRTGHVCIALEGSTAHVIRSLDQNWSHPNRFTLETHGYDEVVGWLRARMPAEPKPKPKPRMPALHVGWEPNHAATVSSRAEFLETLGELYDRGPSTLPIGVRAK